jgi:BirA family transcriptional regulator, biotin operon repressor / biotin---[acetyl-CoA-carboxylase] ligase
VNAPGDIWSARIWPPGWTVRHVEQTGSTNADLLAFVESAAPAVGQIDRTVLVADHQTAGRGRLDRRWEAPAGANLLMSLVAAPVPDRAVEVTHRVGLAAVAAVRRLCPGSRVGLKWPNDVLLDDRKLAGILAQRSSRVDAAVIGLGLNVRWAPEGAASLAEMCGDTPVAAGATVGPADVLAAILREYDALPADVGDLYRRELLTLGRAVRVELPSAGPEPVSVTGRAIDVDAEGRLSVLDDCAVSHWFDVGDIVHLRQSDPD